MKEIIEFFNQLVPSSSSQADIINTIFYQFLILAGFIFLIVALLLFVGIYRYRAKSEDEPKQSFGNRKLEIFWTIVPMLLLTFFFYLTVQAMIEINTGINDRENPDIIIIAKQWWWEIQYPKLNVTTANELHIPVDKNLVVKIESGDVIHDWSVPALGRKIDAIPGRPNFTHIESSDIGVYYGACNEYCGTQHAWMRIAVFVEGKDDFNKWVKAQREIPVLPNDSLSILGAKLFQEKTCSNCHTISGTPANSNIGPNLTHFASRKMMLSGMMPVSDVNLKKWLSDPQKVKSGAHMPNFRLSKKELNALVEYIGKLK